MNPDFFNIAKKLFSRPRLISKQKKEMFGLQGVAGIIHEISNCPDDYTFSLKDNKSGMRCAVCNVIKSTTYFHDSQIDISNEIRICKYCTWRVKEKIEEKFREKKGLPPKEKEEIFFEIYRDYSNDVNIFLENYKQKYSFFGVERKKKLNNYNMLQGYYGLASPYDISKLSSEKFLKSTEYKEIYSNWNFNCTLLIEFFLNRYGIFTLAFINDVEKLLFEILNKRKIHCKFLDIYIRVKIYNEIKLFNIYANDFNNRAGGITPCDVCGSPQSITGIKPDLIRWTDGVILPLCNNHWHTLKRSLYPLVVDKESMTQYQFHIKDILCDHTCPVCKKNHSWKNRTYDFTESFYSIPPRFREICYDCLDLALNHSPSRKASNIDIEGILKIKKIIGDIPSKEMFEVVYIQCDNIGMASQVVSIMKQIFNFRKLAALYDSWFVVLVRSGCLPNGVRKGIYGTRVLAEDGHECLSMGEMHIDNLMYAYSLPHRKEVTYPQSNLRTDWVVEFGKKEVYVEYFGLAGKREYDKKIEIKRRLAADNQIILVEFYPSDFQDLNLAFEKKLLRHSSV